MNYDIDGIYQDLTRVLYRTRVRLSKLKNYFNVIFR